MCVVQEDPLEKSPDPPGFRREDPFDQDEMDEQECLHACMLFVVGASTAMTMVCFVPTYASYPVQTMPQEVSEEPKVYGPSNFDDSIYQKSYMDVCDTLSMSMDQVGNMAGPEIGYI